MKRTPGDLALQRLRAEIREAMDRAKLELPLRQVGSETITTAHKWWNRMDDMEPDGGPQ